MKKRGFVSHIHEELTVAEYLKDWLESGFLGQLEVFVSTLDMEPGGWLEQVRRSLRGASFAFPLLSQAAMERPWINFESGGAYIADDVQLIPLCHRNLIPDRLVPPYSHLQSYDLRNVSSVALLVQYLARELGLRSPTLDLRAFSDEVGRLDAALNVCYGSFEDLKGTPELADALSEVRAPVEIAVQDRQVQVWNDLELRVAVHQQRVLELHGHTRDAMGLDITEVPIPAGAR